MIDLNLTNETSTAIKKVLQLEVEDVFNRLSPLTFDQKNRFPEVEKLPGGLFKPDIRSKKLIEYDTAGHLLLAEGDYQIPVLTFCLRASGKSPAGFSYSLASLKGDRADIIREVNLKALPKFESHDVQILIWSLQAGLSYSEMTELSKNIIDEVVPQYKSKLDQSFISKIESRWNAVSMASHGMIPDFQGSSDEILNEFSSLGQSLIEIRQFYQLIKKVGNDYESLRNLIETQNLSKENITKSPTQWSQISEQVYARFITEGHFQDIGYLQIRVIAKSKIRSVNSAESKKVSVDYASWVADPKNSLIQSLSFSMLYGYGGVLVLPAMSKAPLASTVILLAILSTKIINWDDFFHIADLMKESKDQIFNYTLDEGLEVLSKKT